MRRTVLLQASYLRYFLMGSQATSRITIEGSSSRKALMAEIYRVMMSDVLTPTREAEGVGVSDHGLMAWMQGAWMLQALCSTYGVGGEGLAALLPQPKGEIRSTSLRNHFQPQTQAQRLLETG